MNDYVTKEEFKESCSGINSKIDNITNNHLDSIYSALVWLSTKIEQLEARFFKILAAGIAIIAVVLAIIEVFG